MSQLNLSKTSELISAYKIKVLLIDDQRIYGAKVQAMLDPFSEIEFLYCQNPTEAIKMAEEFEPTVILQDLIMPDIDGLTLVKFFRAHPKLKDIPLIVLSSKEEAVVKEEAFELGANDYMVKLPHEKEVLARIRYHSKGYISLLQRNAAYAALEESQRNLAAELAKAAEYCTSLLPDRINLDNVETDWRFIPSEQLGGDSFVYHWIDDDHFALYLLDVCGHGVGSALLSVSALNALRVQSLSGADFHSSESVLSAMNRSFQMSDHNDMYFTMWYGVYNRKTGELNYSSAGHPPSILIKPDGSVEMLACDNFIIGGIPDFPYSSKTIKIDPGSRIYVFSDGAYEIFYPDGSMWSIEQMTEFIRENIALGDEIELLYKHIIDISQKEILDDDFSMLKVFLK